MADLPETPADDDRSTWFASGSAAVTFNAPLSVERASGMVRRLASLMPGSGTVVDLGCGAGRLARMVAAGLPSAVVIGVDNDPLVVERARALTAVEGLADRVRFDVADAAGWTGPVDAVICVGASHVFGGPKPMFERLSVVVPEGVAIVGDGMWMSEPDVWCRATFGEEPDGVAGLVALAEAAGWEVLDADASTLDEWDEFEHTWIGGVRSVGTPEALAFAAERERGYERYRGVLGFAWLVLRRHA